MARRPPSEPMRRAGACLLLLAALGGSCIDESSPQPPPAHTGASTAAPDTEPPDRVPVIVTLAVPFTPEGHLGGEQAVDRQRQAIQAAQTRVIEELAPYSATVTVRFTSTPQLALLVDDAALRHLRESPWVASVQEDVPDPPASPD